MKISTKGRYALRIMIDLAENADTLVPLKDISERQGITVKYLEQIISKLVKSQLVTASRGNGGGYRLSRRAQDYRISEIFAVTEGDFCPVPCTENGSSCERLSDCKACDFWKGLQKTVNDYLNGQTLEDIVKNVKAASKRDPSIWIL